MPDLGKPAKFKIIVSDLHLGAGHEPEGNRLEDFDRDQVFAAFLDEIAAESDREGRDVELIVNGDAFEMLQVPHLADFDPKAVYPAERYHSSSEADSVRKMVLILAGHRAFFEALGRFIHAGNPRRRVTFVKGNHDLNLHWRGVQATLRRGIGASGEQSSLLSFEERCVLREGIYVEHGNQYAELVDRVQDMNNPEGSGKSGQLCLPLGSWFVMNFLNRVERERYWIDGVKPITALVWYALAYDFDFAIRAIAALLGALPGTLWEGLLVGEEPQAMDLATQVEDPSKVAQWAGHYGTDEAFRAQFNAELARLLAPASVPTAGDTLAFAPVADPVAMGDQVRQQVNSSLFQAAARLAAEKGVKLVTFGHTHEPVLERLPGGGVYVNSGTWTWRADLSRASGAVWAELFAHPERFTQDRCLTCVRVDYDEAGQPVGRLLAYQPKGKPSPTAWPEVLQSLWEQLLDWLQQLGALLRGRD